MRTELKGKLLGRLNELIELCFDLNPETYSESVEAERKITNMTEGIVKDYDSSEMKVSDIAERVGKLPIFDRLSIGYNLGIIAKSVMLLLEKVNALEQKIEYLNKPSNKGPYR